MTTPLPPDSTLRPASGLRRTRALGAGAAAGLLMALAYPSALAETAAQLYQGADLAHGEKLLREHRCAECHARKFGGDGSTVYRPQGRINSPGALRGMVEHCRLELDLALFPDEITSISAVLNRDFYRFK